MSIGNLTKSELERRLGREVLDAHVLVAKNQVLGAGPTELSELLGADLTDVQEILDDPKYKEILLIVSTEYNSSKVEAELTWDAIEQGALKNIAKKINSLQDVETNLRIAAVANKAQRRNTMRPDHLDPRTADQRVNIKLSERIIKKLTAKGGEEITTERKIIAQGVTLHPNFEEVQSFLLDQKPKESQSNVAQIERRVETAIQVDRGTLDEFFKQHKR